MTSGIKEKAINNILYPNPTSGFITIPLENIQVPDVKVSIYDVSGKLIYSEGYKIEGKSITLDVSKYNKGSYTILLDTGKNFTQTYKFIKE